MQPRLRSVVIVVFSVCLLSGAALVAAVSARLIPAQFVVPGVWLLIVGAILFAGTVFERTRYKPILTRPPEGWTQTAERFIDDRTQQTVEVYIHPQTGERAYVGSA